MSSVSFQNIFMLLLHTDKKEVFKFAQYTRLFGLILCKIAIRCIHLEERANFSLIDM